MAKGITRRDLLKNVGAAGAGAVLGSVPGQGATSQEKASAPAGSSGRILPLTSTSEVIVPTRGRSFFKFSYDFPEPSVEFAGLRFSFRLYTFENAYGLDRARMTVEEKPDGIEIRASGLVKSGGQEKAPGQLIARLHKEGSVIEWDARAETDQPLKSIASVVRGVPRGRISAGGESFFDPKDDEVLLGYPFGGGALFVARGMNTPLAVIQSGENDYFYLSTLHDHVRANRFYFQPGEKTYRVELVYEEGGWQKSDKLNSPTWRVGRATTVDAAMQPHFEHLERAFQIPDWEQRRDVPTWLHEIALVMTMHGMHWTGYIFNDFAHMLEILRWVATRIPARRVLVFIPAWDGRYYWNYPLYQPDERMGGEAGFHTLISEGQKLGFRFMPMFGMNSANERLKVFSQFSDATTAQIDGDPYYLNWVDWDNDRRYEGWMPYMNVGVDSWRNYLVGRIADIIERFHVNAYFLDISGGWVNNPKADMHEGTRKLVATLRERYPDILACGEFYYDALFSFIPLFHVFSESAYPAALTKYARAFQHLSHPAPGRGSSGVHEFGFSRFDPKTLSLGEHQIPTLNVVDDTFVRYRELMDQVIQRAKERARIA